MKSIRLFLIAAIIAATAAVGGGGVVFAWAKGDVTPDCAPGPNSLAWTVNLPQESDYHFDWSFDKNFSTFTTEGGGQGDNFFQTPRGGTTLYVRWSQDHNVTWQGTANTELCFKPVRQTSVKWYGPCGDPMHGVVVRNTGDFTETFKFKFDQFTVGWLTKTYVVAPHSTRWSGYKHVLGHTKMTVTNRGNVWTRWSAAPGSYGTCVAPGSFTTVR